MATSKTLWREKTGRIYWAVLLISLLPIIQGAIELYSQLDDMRGLMFSMANGGADMEDFFKPDMSDILPSLIFLFAYILYFTGLSGFARMQTEADKEAVLSIRTGAIWSMIGAVIGFELLFGIIGAAVMMGGFGKLKKSATFPEEAAKAMGTLRSAMIWTIVALVIDLLPVIGDFIAMLINFILFFVVLGAWWRVKNAEPLTISARTTSGRVSFSEAPGGLLILFGLILYIIVWPVFLLFHDLYSIEMGHGLPNDVMNIIYYSVNIIGCVLLPLGCFALYRRFAEYRNSLYVLFAALLLQLVLMVLSLCSDFIFIGEKPIIDYMTYRYINLFLIALFFIAYIFLKNSWKNRLVSIGANWLIAYAAITFLLSLTSVLLVKNELYEVLQAINPIFQLFPFIGFFFCLNGWRFILSGAYGEGEVVPENDILPRPVVAEVASAAAPAAGMQFDENLLHRMATKSEKELKEIIENAADYNEKFVAAAKMALEIRSHGKPEAVVEEATAAVAEEETVVEAEVKAEPTADTTAEPATEAPAQ